MTKKGEYALRTMIRLGVAERLQEGVVSTSSIAVSDKLPFKFLEAVLFQLKQGGFVECFRGKNGGVKLAKPASKIRIAEIVRHFDGRLAPIGCASETDYESCSCPNEEHCGLRMIMIDVRNSITRILDHYTLVEVTLRKSKGSKVRKPAAKKFTKARRKAHADPADGFLNWLLKESHSN